MNKQQEALKLALEALEYLRKPIAQGWEAETQQEKRDQAITAIREALVEQPAQQEPVAWRWKMSLIPDAWQLSDQPHPEAALKEALYPSPPASKPWVGLTDEEKADLFEGTAPYYNETDYADAIEAKLREKNA